MVTTSFDEVTARLDRGGSFYLYLSTEQWLSKLSEKINHWRDLAVAANPGATPEDKAMIAQVFNLAATLVQEDGIEHITGFGASTLAVEPELYRNTFFIHHYKGKQTGLLSTLAGTTPHALDALGLLPANTAIASYGDLDLARAVGGLSNTLEQSQIPDVRQAVANGLTQFSAVAGMSLDDALKSLGGAMGVVVTLDPEHPIQVQVGVGPKQPIPGPRAAMIFEVKDDRIFTRIDQLMGMLPGLVKVDEAGLRMDTFALPPFAAVPDLPVRATAARWDRYLFFASDDQLVRDIIAARKTGQGFKASPAFARLSSGLPAEGNGFSLVSQSFEDAVRQFQSAVIKNQPHSTPGQEKLMHELFAAQGGNASYGVSAHLENGWLNVSKSSRNANQILLPLVIAPAAIIAGVALPVFNTMQQRHLQTPPDATTRGVRSLAQAKQIGLACRSYASDHEGNFPPSLEALIPMYTQNRALFISPYAPREPMGYHYHIGLTDKSGDERILLEDAYSSAAGQRVFVRIDNSGEVQDLKKE